LIGLTERRLELALRIPREIDADAKVLIGQLDAPFPVAVGFETSCVEACGDASARAADSIGMKTRMTVLL
jgi:hypothetical protein